MIRFLLLSVVGVAILVGCAKKDARESADSEKTPDSGIAAESDGQREDGSPNSIQRQSRAGDEMRLEAVEELLPLTPEQKQLQSMVGNVAQLMLDARNLEANQKFSEAIQVWREIENAVIAQYGNSSWQATNARLGLQSAELRSKLDFDGRRQLYDLHQIDRQGDQHFADNQLVPALETRHEASTLARQIFGRDSHLTAIYLFKQAQSHQSVGQFPEAETLMRQTLDIREVAMGKAHPEYASVEHALAILYQQQGQMDMSLPLMRESKELCAKVWGVDSKAHAAYTNDLGVLLNSMARYAEAKTVFDQALSLYERADGTETFDYAHCQYNHATVELAVKDYDAAEAGFRSALNKFLANRGENHEMVAQTKTQLATVLLIEGNNFPAEELLEQVVEYRRQAQGTQSLAYAKSLFQWGVSLGNQGKYNEAEPALMEAFQIQKSQLSPTHPEVVTTAQVIATVYRRTGRPADANEIENQVRTAQRRP